MLNKLKIKLSKKVNSIRSHRRRKEYYESVVYNAFNSAYVCDKNHFDPCEHEMWVYAGSYYQKKDYADQPYLKKGNSEDLFTDFSFNKYICVDCGHTVNTSDWQLFEETHHVLKKPKNNWGIYETLSYYYQLLYNYPVDEAKEKFEILFETPDTRSLKKK